jgi:hypothetical protein
MTTATIEPPIDFHYYYIAFVGMHGQVHVCRNERWTNRSTRLLNPKQYAAQ